MNAPEADIAFGVYEDAVPTELLMIADQRRLILRVFDHCLDGRLYQTAEMKHIANGAVEQYKDLLQRKGLIETSNPSGNTW